MKKGTTKPLAKWSLVLLGILAIGWVIYLMPLGRELAVRLLGKTGSMSTPLLRRALQDENHMVRWAARDALLELGPRAVPPLVRALTDKDARVRAQAAQALSALGPTARDALPSLIAAFNDPDDDVRVKAMTALRFIGEQPVEAFPTLLSISHDSSNGHVRAVAVQTLGAFGNLDINLLTPAFLQSLKDPDAEVRTEAAEAFSKLARRRMLPDEAIPALREALKDPSKEVRDEAAEALSMIGIEQRTSDDKD
jgi:HEAT repeat protein